MKIATPKIYKKYRDQIKTGDLILFKARDPISRLISWKTNKLATNQDSKDAAHAAMACWSAGPTGTVRLWILESVLFGTTKSYLSNRITWYMPHGDIWWFKMLPEWQGRGAEAAESLHDLIGRYYDFQDLLLQAFKRATLDPTRIYCSEYVTLGWKDIVGLPDDFKVPYPCEMNGDGLGVYEKRGEKLT